MSWNLKTTLGGFLPSYTAYLCIRVFIKRNSWQKSSKSFCEHLVKLSNTSTSELLLCKGELCVLFCNPDSWIWGGLRSEHVVLAVSHNLAPVESQGEKPLQIKASLLLPTGARGNF